MNGGLVPLFLLSATLALMLSFAPIRMTSLGLLAFAAITPLLFLMSGALSSTIIFLGLWASMIATALVVYLPIARWSAAILPLCLNAGFWMGAYAALYSDRAGLALGLVPALLAFPVKWLIRRKFDIVIKVVASWMIAIASLSMFVSLMPTPGYKLDHME
ncbi:MAG: hypothetical protein H0W65_06655 [Sphingomonas sp.]|uniref:hypothetical protein n=1 Tax=Sphingomonas sp. TaxID=28214 RepID=UPI0017C38AD4|nr:hypothetical protein [Sphingomonas sp.]MBA3667386.1 hypothetical protein [Sphingomonas sp.]